ncbi:Atg38p SCDLUD_000257 [Saccharomycodes ludwigii]|uniref:Atg38p n=1 Tax=Saccharomycodes ludwigii TaxID=36035 RepID=UPI001E81F19C|nr:hypothetical protein SCDLUD_000257 [Saccharomycodes ludwigii]KAH3902674.1 hypothetical protein SCDLUD_000257 [Saccharomycodes ludwigii]
MTGLEQAYTFIDEAEAFVLKKDFQSAIEKYESAKKDISNFLLTQKSSKTNYKIQNTYDETIVDNDLESAIEILNDQVTQRINRLTKYNQVNCIKVSNNNTILKNSQKDISGKIVILNDSILETMVNDLEFNLLAHFKNSDGLIKNEVNQFKLKLVTYENKINTEKNKQFKELIEANKNLREQVEKLNNRWENLVASARQKRRSSTVQ